MDAGARSFIRPGTAQGYTSRHHHNSWICNEERIKLSPYNVESIRTDAHTMVAYCDPHIVFRNRERPYH